MLAKYNLPENLLRRAGKRRTDRRSAAERFFEQYVEEPNTGCWLWHGFSTARGYGRFWLAEIGGPIIASRFSYLLHTGPIPEGMHVLHRCDTPACVNPDHLFLGTNRDNIIDCWSKGRRTFVDKDHRRAGHWNARLTEDDVRNIRMDGRFHRVIAAEYGMSRSQISKIKKGVAW